MAALAVALDRDWLTGVSRRRSRPTVTELDPLVARVCRRLKETVEARGVTQLELAEMAGVDQGNISKILRGEKPEVSLLMIMRLVRALNVQFDWLISDPPMATPPTPPQGEPTPPTATIIQIGPHKRAQRRRARSENR